MYNVLQILPHITEYYYRIEYTIEIFSENKCFYTTVVTAVTYGKHVGWWCAPHIILLYVEYFNAVVASLFIAIITLYQFNIVQA